MNKRITALFITIVFTFSCVFAVYANIDNGGTQTDPYFGLPYNPTNLGEYDTNGFLYSEVPFTNMHAADKGLIPSPVTGQYKSPSTWAKDEVIEASKMNLNNMEIITGYQGDITRAEFVKLMVQAYFKYAWQATEVNKKIPLDWENDIFNDISNVKNKDYITWAYYLDITQGTGNGKFNPDSKITRQEMATMLYRYILIFNKAFAYDQSVKKNFDDDGQIANWAKKEVRTIANREIIKGYPGNLFKPLDNATREESLLLDLRTNKTFVDVQVTNNLSKPSGLNININKLYWNPVNNSQNYNIYQDKHISNSQIEHTYFNRTDSTNFDLSSLNTHAGTYDFTVQAFNEFYMSPVSNPQTVIVPEPVKNTIGWDSATNIVVWDSVTEATKYVVSVKSKPGTASYSFEQSVSAPTISTALSGLIVGGAYTVKITAYTNDFYSAATTKDIIK